mgnify:CR=1 FL=1|jgi:Ca2+/Na+ antiporter
MLITWLISTFYIGILQSEGGKNEASGGDIAGGIFLVALFSTPLSMLCTWYLYYVFVLNIKRAFTEPIDDDEEEE